MEYENVIPKLSLLIESILKSTKQFYHAQFYFVVSGLKIIGHGNPDNNLEMTLYISALKHTRLILFILDM
jgi:hypothetical protein